MKISAQVKHLDKLEASIKRLTKKAEQDNAKVIVGYSAPYAMYVHEAVDMVLAGEPRPSGIGKYWSPQGAQAKFLEKPARQHKRDIGDLIATLMKQGRSLKQALRQAGQALLRESKRLVPVEYGNLKRSGFVKVESEK